jgi:integrase
MARGCVFKRGKKYVIKWRDSGQQRWKTIGPSRSAAERTLRDILNRVEDGTYRELERIRFEDLCSRWMREYAGIRLKRSTLRSYGSILQNLQTSFKTRILTDITAADIDQYLSKRVSQDNASLKTAANEITLLHQLLETAIRWNCLRVNPCRSIKRLRPPIRPMDFLTSIEVGKLLAHVEARFRPLFLTAVLTGMRRGELLALFWSDFDWERNVVHVQRTLDNGSCVTPKSKASIRDVLLTPGLRRALDAFRNSTKTVDSQLVFAGAKGGFLKANWLIRKHFVPALEKAGLRRIRFHDLRHTYAALAIRQGAHPKFIQSQLGHASIQTTLDRYGHLLLKDHEDIGRRLDCVLTESVVEFPSKTVVQSAP